MIKYLTAMASLILFSAAAFAQVTGPQWIEEFTERPPEWGGDIRYSFLDMPGRQALKVGCVRNRIERVLIVFPEVNNALAPIADNPQVRYAFDNEAMQATDWPLFEEGSIEVPRGGQSSRITRRIAAAERFVVQANARDGSTLTAEFDLLDSELIVPKMLGACGIR